MNVKYMAPFVSSAFEVLKLEAGISANRGELILEKCPYQTEDITVVIALVGRITGNVFYSMTYDVGLSLVSRMMGEKVMELDNLAQSGIAELGNVITGKASVLLSEAGFEATISPPTLLVGRGAAISTLDFPRLVVPMETECGRICIHLALRENPMSYEKTNQIPIPSRPGIR
ncbi:MAG: chemotaxis protein CheX [Chloroflexi bacterium]|nr:chemotaxis protein CheX [Chloroflexota bacterium]